jgi:hypothetical protein
VPDTDDTEIKIEPGQMWIYNEYNTHVRHTVMILEAVDAPDAFLSTGEYWKVLNTDGKTAWLWEVALRNYYRLLQPVPENGIERNHG